MDLASFIQEALAADADLDAKSICAVIHMAQPDCLRPAFAVETFRLTGPLITALETISPELAFITLMHMARVSQEAAVGSSAPPPALELIFPHAAPLVAQIDPSQLPLCTALAVDALVNRTGVKERRSAVDPVHVAIAHMLSQRLEQHYPGELARLRRHVLSIEKPATIVRHFDPSWSSTAPSLCQRALPLLGEIEQTPLINTFVHQALRDEASPLIRRMTTVGMALRRDICDIEVDLIKDLVQRIATCDPAAAFHVVFQISSAAQQHEAADSSARRLSHEAFAMPQALALASRLPNDSLAGCAARALKVLLHEAHVIDHPARLSNHLALCKTLLRAVESRHRGELQRVNEVFEDMLPGHPLWPHVFDDRPGERAPRHPRRARRRIGPLPNDPAS